MTAPNTSYELQEVPVKKLIYKTFLQLISWIKCEYESVLQEWDDTNNLDTKIPQKLKSKLEKWKKISPLEYIDFFQEFTSWVQVWSENMRLIIEYPHLVWKSFKNYTELDEYDWVNHIREDGTSIERLLIPQDQEITVWEWAICTQWNYVYFRPSILIDWERFLLGDKDFNKVFRNAFSMKQNWKTSISVDIPDSYRKKLDVFEYDFRDFIWIKLFAKMNIMHWKIELEKWESLEIIDVQKKENGNDLLIIDIWWEIIEQSAMIFSGKIFGSLE